MYDAQRRFHFILLLPKRSQSLRHNPLSLNKHSRVGLLEDCGSPSAKFSVHPSSS
jgi:hypothetical protein